MHESWLIYLHRRYLRARKFVPEEALKQFKDTEDWRKANKLDELYDTIDIGEYEQSRRLVSITISLCKPRHD